MKPIDNCSVCKQKTAVTRKNNTCEQCYRKNLKEKQRLLPCIICNKDGGSRQKKMCYNCYITQKPKLVCSRCGFLSIIEAHDLCRTCYQKTPARVADRIKRSKDPSEHTPERKSEKKAKFRNLKLRIRYGITFEDKIKILEEQNNKCKICFVALVADHQDTHIDHEHSTGKIRGVLCKLCNTLLGLARDNSQILQEAINYLNNSNKP